MKVKLAIVSTHPIQYYAPIFRTLARHEAIDLRVFYTWSQVAGGTIDDKGFGTTLKWDIPLRDGYPHEFVRNVAKRDGPDHFLGLRTPELSKAITGWGAQAVLVYGWNSWSHLSVLRHFNGRIPVLFRGDSTILDERSALRSGARWLALRWIYSHVDLAIAVGRNNSDYFRRYGLTEQRIRIAPHSVDVRRFVDSERVHQRQAEVWRTELGISEAEPVVLYAGKFIAKKDPRLLLHAFERIETPAHLVFYGNGDLESELRHLAGDNPRLHFRPFQNQGAMPTVYRVGDVFVLPSRGPGETWGLALNEAMASARPVIASSKVGGARDLIFHGDNGWMFEAGNVEALAGVLRDALGRGREDLARMGLSAQRCSESWTSEIAAEKIASAVAEAIQRTGARRL